MDKTSLSPPIYYLKTPSVKEIERIALEEAERTSPNYAREKEIRRKGYAKYKFLKGFKSVLKGREVIYKLEWVSVKLLVLYGDKGRVKTQVEERLLREKVFKVLMILYSVLGGKLNAKCPRPKRVVISSM